jgi:hypothetical protein
MVVLVEVLDAILPLVGPVSLALLLGSAVAMCMVVLGIAVI